MFFDFLLQKDPCCGGKTCKRLRSFLHKKLLFFDLNQFYY